MIRSARRGIRSAVVGFALLGLLAPATAATAATPGLGEATERGGNAAAAAARPFFQLPFACNTSIRLTTYPGHGPYDIDMWLAPLAPVLASADGTVVWSGWDDSGGWVVRLDHGGNYESEYVHLAERPPVPLGARVVRGQPIGKLGNTGNASGGSHHLHYEQKLNHAQTESWFNGVPSGFVSDAKVDEKRLTSKNCATEPEEPPAPPAAVVFGDTEGSPAIGRHGDGRLELFPLTKTGGINNIYESLPSGPWSGPYGFGPDLPVRQVLPVNHGDGRMEVFAVGTDGSVWNRFEISVGGTWSGWHSFAPAGSATAVVAARHYNSNRLEIFAVKADGSMWNRYESRVNGPWSDWQVFAPADRRIKSATLGVHADNRLEVFAVTADGSVLHKYETTADGPWSNWESFGPAGTAAYLKVGRHGSARLEVFAVKADGSISNKLEPIPNGAWSGWHGFAVAGTVSTDPRALNVAAHHGGRLEVFAVAPNGAVRNKFEASVDSPWSDWNGFADPGHAVHVNATRHSDNRLEVFTTAADGSVSNNFETAPNAPWAGWNPYLPAQ